MPNVIIANTNDYEAFKHDYIALASLGVPFRPGYIEYLTNNPTHGGWGALIFEIPIPSSTIFNNPSVEYRYSDELQGWTVNGELSPLSQFIEGLKDYFLSIDGGVQ